MKLTHCQSHCTCKLFLFSFAVVSNICILFTALFFSDMYFLDMAMWIGSLSYHEPICVVEFIRNNRTLAIHNHHHSSAIVISTAPVASFSYPSYPLRFRPTVCWKLRIHVYEKYLNKKRKIYRGYGFRLTFSF
ncbi:hypothetical protein QVD17_02886 [Tagetes erecta]|uniref:Uncharacterized protein n=1 Tax=Tagetes erecta TaxID=13708 RepID=A0AAD8P9J6_TARER|nr:hypothetical protein QVD17_02886 [Tagetes erecta]